MKAINVLILGVGGNVSQGICKAIKNSDLNCHLIGACIAPTSVGLYFCDEALLCPYAVAPDFLPWLIKTCNDKKIDIVFTGVEENIIVIMKNYDHFSSAVKTKFIASDYNMLLIGQDKLATCEWLKSHGCNYPEYCPSGNTDELMTFSQKVNFPIIGKPRSGKGSKGLLIVNNSDELIAGGSLDNYVFQKCIGTENSEYTVGIYADKNGNIMPPIIMKRFLSNGGTSYAKVVYNDAVYMESIKIASAFKPKGPLNIQMRLDENGKAVCFELNVRFSGTTPIRAHFGFKDVEAMLKEYIFDMPVDKCFNIYEGECFRYINEIYLKKDSADILNERGKCDDIKSFLPEIERMGYH